MKFAGILKEHESGRVKIGQSLNDLYIFKDKIQDFEQIVSYLKNGTVLISFLHYVYNGSNEPIGPLIYYTDGEWIWPSYIVYYLSKNYNGLLPKEFIDDIQANNFNMPAVDREKLSAAEKFYMSTYG